MYVCMYVIVKCCFLCQEIDRVLILDVRLHTQDFLTAGHVRSNSSNTITIPVLYLDRNVLTR